MAMRAETSTDFTRTPFFVSDARAAGLRWRDLQTKRFTRLSRGQYTSSAVRRDTTLTLSSVAQRMPAGFRFSGPTAGWLWNLDYPPCDPVEVTYQGLAPDFAGIYQFDFRVPLNAGSGFLSIRCSLNAATIYGNVPVQR